MPTRHETPLAHGKTALLTADLVQVLAHLPYGLRGIRDRALLLLGYTGAVRRPEDGFARRREDVYWYPAAVTVYVPEETIQSGGGFTPLQVRRLRAIMVSL